MSGCHFSNGIECRSPAHVKKFVLIFFEIISKESIILNSNNRSFT